MMKKLLICFVVFLLTASIVLGGAGVFFVRFALERQYYNDEYDYTVVARRTPNMAVITAHDGIELAARVYRPKKDVGHKWLIALHGYHSDNGACKSIAYKFLPEGYNVLLPDLRAHGESGGKYIGMGWVDRLDLLDWIDYVISIDPRAQIILHGSSMGGATVMMAAGEELPHQVKGVIEDCGYTSIWDISADRLKEDFGLPQFPVMQAANIVSRIMTGLDFSQGSCVEQVAKAKVPILFIHGAEDDFVRTEMVYELYDAWSSPKELLVVEHAGHAQSNYRNAKLYYETVFSFISEYCISE